MTDAAPATTRMRLRYAGRCWSCAQPVGVGEWANYDRVARTFTCLGCTGAVAAGSEPHARPVPAARPDADGEPIDPGLAGGSARREHARRVARREQHVRQNHPRLGGVILALSDEPSTTRVWATGAVGEERLGQRLDAAADDTIRVLHDRRIPGTRANIDHVVISPAGVFVIDAKRYQGRRPQVQGQGGIVRPRIETLLVGTRDCTNLVDGVRKQVDHVRAAIAPIDPTNEIVIRGMLCFLDADWPLFGGAFTIAGVDVLWPKKAVQRITSPGDGLDESQVDQLHRLLAATLAAA